MSQAFLRQVVAIPETAWGTPGASGYVLRVFADFSPREESPAEEVVVCSGNRLPALPVQTTVDAGLSLSVPLFIDEIGWWLKYAMGVPATAGSASPYTHTFKAGFSGASTGDLPAGLAIDLGYTDITQYGLLVGGRVQSMTIPINPAGAFRAAIEIAGKSWTYASVAQIGSPTSYTTQPLGHRAISALTVSGSSNTRLTGGEITLANNLDTNAYTVNNSGLRGELPSGNASVTGWLEFLFPDLTQYNLAKNWTESSLGVTWTSGANSLAITVPELYFGLAAPANQPGLRLRLPFIAGKGDHADATVVKAVLVNAIASY